jgi:outer membrane biosynthesis protein TonB
MARLTTAVLAVALGGACALALVSCGGSDAKLLPGDTAQEITENLDAVKQLASENECVDAEDAALEVSSQIESLEGIDPKLKENLTEGAEVLNRVVDTCTEETTEEEPVDTVETTEEEETSKPKKPSAEEKDAEKEQERAEKEQEKEEKEEEKEAEPPAQEKEPPAEAEPPGQEKEAPSGGIGPGSEAGSEG